jgi:hypothetical protein
MSTIELKELLKSKIDNTNDDVLLSEVNLILSRKSESIESYNLDLQQSENDILNGKIYSHTQVLEEIKEWKKR